MYVTARVALIKWLKKIVDRDKESYWLYQARYWTGQQLGTVKTEWTWLRSNLTPHGNPKETPKWYKILIQFTQKHREEIAKLDIGSLSNQRIRLMDNENTEEEPRGMREWRRYRQLPTNTTKIWNRIWHSLNDNRVKQFMWKFLHRVLTTKSYLATWGMRVNLECPFCNHREDMHHAILGCFRARKLWDNIDNILTGLAGKKIQINLDTIVFGTYLPDNEVAHRLCQFVLELSAATLWFNRNKKIQNNVYVEQDLFLQVTKTIKNRIRTELTINSERIENIWRYKQVLCTYDNGHLTLRI